MPWSKPVVEQFSLVDRSTKEESDWYGPFTTLMFELFPLSEEYRVSPQPKRIKGSEEFAVRYVVRKERVPIFFVEIKTCSLVNVSDRALADAEMRDYFHGLISDSSIPMPSKLIGISAFGTKFSVYTLTTNTRSIEPAIIVVDPNVIKDIAPEERWCFDFLDDEGEVRLREVVAAVKDMASNL